MYSQVKYAAIPVCAHKPLHLYVQKRSLRQVSTLEEPELWRGNPNPSEQSLPCDSTTTAIQHKPCLNFCSSWFTNLPQIPHPWIQNITQAGTLLFWPPDASFGEAQVLLSPMNYHSSTPFWQKSPRKLKTVSVAESYFPNKVFMWWTFLLQFWYKGKDAISHVQMEVQVINSSWSPGVFLYGNSSRY